MSTTKEKRRPTFIGITGGTASGKTTICKTVVDKLNLDKKSLTILDADLFYKEPSPENIELAKKGQFNMDHPDAYDFDLFFQTVKKLSEGEESVEVPIYSYSEHKRIGTKNFNTADVIIIEGILLFHDPRVAKICKLKIFIHCDAEIRLARRIKRDICERGRNVDGILNQYLKFTKPAFEQFCLPTQKLVNFVGRGENYSNGNVVDLICKFTARAKSLDSFSE